jgi:foldase protein PrsA
VKKRSRFAVLVALVAGLVSGLITGCGEGLPDDAVAKVGEAYISKAEFARQIEDASAYYGVSKETDPENYERMEDIILDDLVQVELAKQKAAGLGVTVTDDEVEDAVAALVDEYFGGDQAALESQLTLQGRTIDDLRAERRDALTIQGVYDAVTTDITSVPDEDVETYYQANKSDYLTQQTVNARHILIAVGNSASADDSTSTTTTEATDSGSTEDTTTLDPTTTTTEVSDLAWAEALVTASRLRLELLKGGSWAELAKEYSDDESTKDSNGDLGEISQGALADKFGYEFDSALFALGLDEISEPVKTSAGYHIIQVTAINEPAQKALAEVRDEIVDILLSDAKYQAWIQWVEEAKQELGVIYRKDLQPTTTTESTTTTLAAESTSTTARP